jgi:ABC-type polysaccharide/polyol phosphate transport system ATPase subunit
MEPIIEAKNIGVKFTLSRFKKKTIRTFAEELFGINKQSKQNKEFWALKDVSFDVNEGDILGVLGSNGSGKSTLLRTIAGVYTPDKGSMKVRGTVSPLLSLGTGFKPELNGLENIFLNGVIMGFSRKEIKENLEEIIDFSEIRDFINEPVKNYSSGMRARLGFSIAVHLKRDIMLIDEILGVGDFKFRKKSQDKMKEIIKSGQTIIIVSHNLDSIKEYATKAIWINKGVLMDSGKVDDVLSNYLKS